MKHTGCINTVDVQHTPYEVCTGIPSLDSSQTQEQLSYTVLQYNSEISNIQLGGAIEAICKGRVARKSITLFLMHLVLMQ